MTTKKTNKKNKESKGLLKKNLLSVFGVSPDNLQVQIKGDLGIRETVYSRTKNEGILDKECDKFLKIFEHLLMETGVHTIYIGYNNQEIRTQSVFDPFSQEAYNADCFLDEDFINQVFPEIDYTKKLEYVKNICRFVYTSNLELIPQDWLDIIDERNQNFDAANVLEIRGILASLKMLREIEGFYLRNVTVSILQKSVRMQFNCDGTTYVAINNFNNLMETIA